MRTRTTARTAGSETVSIRHNCITFKERLDQEFENQKAGKNLIKKDRELEKAKIKRYVYIGETNRSVYERALEHQRDVTSCKTSSHMLCHFLD